MFKPIILFGSEFSEWSEEIPKESENVVVESEVRYRWYKENRVNDKYDFYNENRLSDIDINDFIYTNIIETDEKPEYMPYREFSDLKYYLNYDINKTSQILIDNFVYYDEVEISEIAIYDKVNSKYISYTLSDKSILKGDASRINDGYMTRDCLTVDQNTYLLLLLDKEYNITDFEIHIYISDSKLYNNTFNVSFLKDYKYKIQTKTSIKIVTIYDPLTCFYNHCKMTVSKDNTWKAKSYFEETKYYYVDKLFMYYKTEKEYLDGYHSFVDSYIKDETDYKTYYRYKKEEIVNNINSEANEKERILKEENSATDQKYVNNDNKSIYQKPKEDMNNFTGNEKEETAEEEENVKLVGVEKHISREKHIEVFVIYGLVLSFILIISRIIFKKKKISRAI